MRPATPATVLGDFGNARFEHSGMVTTFSRAGESYVVRTDGPDGAPCDYPIGYTFGVYRGAGCRHTGPHGPGLGQSPEGASVVGINGRSVRFQLFLATGALAGLGGALSVLSYPSMPGDGFPVVLYGSLISLLLSNVGRLVWWLASVFAALVFGVGVATIGKGWEDTLLQVVLWAGLC